jgi:hypothetical protein
MAVGIGVATVTAVALGTVADSALALDSVIPTMAAITATRTLMGILTTAVITIQTRATIPTPMHMAPIPTAILAPNSNTRNSSISTDHPRSNSNSMVRLSSNSSIGKARPRHPSRRRLNKIRLRNSRLRPITTTSRTASGIALANLIPSRSKYV